MRTRSVLLLALLAVVVLVTACAPKPQVVKETVVVEKVVKETVVVAGTPQIKEVIVTPTPKPVDAPG